MDDHINCDYETDLLAWTNSQVALLRAKKFDQVDLENVIAELEYLVRRDKRAVASRIFQLLTHLLKYKYQPARISNSWLHTISSQRRQIETVLDDMPSLRASIDEYVAKNYPKAVKQAAKETHLPLLTFPESSPFTTQQILDDDYLP